MFTNGQHKWVYYATLANNNNSEHVEQQQISKQTDRADNKSNNNNTKAQMEQTSRRTAFICLLLCMHSYLCYICVCLSCKTRSTGRPFGAIESLIRHHTYKCTEICGLYMRVYVCVPRYLHMSANILHPLLKQSEKKTKPLWHTPHFHELWRCKAEAAVGGRDF